MEALFRVEPGLPLSVGQQWSVEQGQVLRILLDLPN
jgi:hypothetical protein